MNRPVRVAIACLLFGASLTHALAADPYPSKPVTIVVPQAPGGTNDIVGRILGPALSQSTGQQFIVDNRPGAGGNIGSQYAARSNPDGYTVLLTISSTQAINPALYKKIPFDPVKDFDPVALVANVPNVLVANPSFPASNMKELIALAKSKPNEFRFASAGNGSLNHLLGEMLNNMAGISLEHVPYKGVGPALNDLLGNQIPLAFASLPSVLPHIKAGKLKALGVSSAQRSAAAPDIPAIGETIPNFSGDLWVALFAVHGTPKDVVAMLTAAVEKVLDDKTVQDKLKAQGAELPRATPQQLSAMLKSDMEKWAKIVQTSGAAVD
jgi:tripartite-type tricarboxylate transporter receptor subunit TctC